MSDTPTERRPAPFRIFSMEGLFGAFALFSLTAGIWRGEAMPIFWGVTILAGLAVLAAVRRRNWQEHWQALEEERRQRSSDNKTPSE